MQEDSSREATVYDPGCPLRFRNYIPRDTVLRSYSLEKPFVKELEAQIDDHIRKTLEDAKKQDVLSQITPKRPNWDLKRDVEKKLRILTARTDKAILQLIRQTMKANGATTPDADTTQLQPNVKDEDGKILRNSITQSVIDAFSALDNVDEELTDFE